VRISAAIAQTPGAPLEVSDLELDDPRDDEILVRILAVGICHTDISAARGRLPVQMPIVLGHEGAGVVERVGARVTRVAPGDRVLLTPDFCGVCRHCRTGATTYCERTSSLIFGGTRPDGSTKARRHATPVRAGFFGQSSFAEYVLVTSRNILKFESTAPIEYLAALTCGVSTGAGSVLHTLRPAPNQSLAVFGVGTVGLAAIMAARMIGVRDIIAVDQHPARLALARDAGASSTVVVDEALDTLDALHALAPNGIDRSFDTTGVPSVIRTAVRALGVQGVCGFVAGTGASVELDLGEMLVRGAQLRGIMGGDATGLVFLADLVAAFDAGFFPIEPLVRTYRLHQINEAFADMSSGRTVKPVIVFDGERG
jgi:aryl-alcohol dehydrogenase